MLRTPETIGFWRGRLPHWEVEDGRYFVTAHLTGAIPQQGIQRIRRLSEAAHQSHRKTSRDSSLPLMRTVFREMEAWLDRTEHNTQLSKPAIAEMVVEAIQHRTKVGSWLVYDYVIMPSHIHMFLSVRAGTLKGTMEDFKRWTGHKAATLTTLPADRFWQDEWFDHWSRSDEQDERIMRYIQQNPVTANLVSKPSEWKYRK